MHIHIMRISYYTTPSESTRRKKTYRNVTNNVLRGGKIINNKKIIQIICNISTIKLRAWKYERDIITIYFITYQFFFHSGSSRIAYVTALGLQSYKQQPRQCQNMQIMIRLVVGIIMILLLYIV